MNFFEKIQNFNLLYKENLKKVAIDRNHEKIVKIFYNFFLSKLIIEKIHVVDLYQLYIR